MPADTEWTQTTTIRLPEEDRAVQIQTDDAKLDVHFYKGQFRTECGYVPIEMVIRWRYHPKPTLPDFVEVAVNTGRYMADGDSVCKRLASCFAWPHDPPQPGDCKLQVVKCVGHVECGPAFQIVK